MASLIVKVHDTVTDYIKKANNKEIAGKIGSDVLEAVRDIVKKHMYDPPNGLTYRVVHPMKILSREIRRVNVLLIRRMKPSPVARSPWKISFHRYMPREVFDLLDNYIQVLSLASSRKQTSFTRSIQVSDAHNVTLLFMKLINMYENETVLKEEDLLQTKCLRNGVICRIVVGTEKPLLIHYSNKRELMRISLYYGCWNMHGVPQHL